VGLGYNGRVLLAVIEIYASRRYRWKRGKNIYKGEKKGVGLCAKMVSIIIAKMRERS
jgi:hypothetical protein